MRTTVAAWELENLGMKTLECSFDPVDALTSVDLASMSGFEHVVAKVPVGKIDLVHHLEEHGFRFMETQLVLKREVNGGSSDGDLGEFLLRKSSRRQIRTAGELEIILERVNDFLFRTDRISLDPEFGTERAALRYSRWLREVITKPDALVFEMRFRGRATGFFYAEQAGETLGVLLGGIYSELQNTGVGPLLVLQPLQLGRELGVRSMKTEVSSNNLPVLRLYEAFGYRVADLRYVLRRIAK